MKFSVASIPKRQIFTETNWQCDWAKRWNGKWTNILSLGRTLQISKSSDLLSDCTSLFRAYRFLLHLRKFTHGLWIISKIFLVTHQDDWHIWTEMTHLKPPPSIPHSPIIILHISATVWNNYDIPWNVQSFLSISILCREYRAKKSCNPEKSPSPFLIYIDPSPDYTFSYSVEERHLMMWSFIFLNTLH